MSWLFALALGCAHRMPVTAPLLGAPDAAQAPAVEALWQSVVEEGHSDALVVMHRGELLLAWPPVDDQVPIETMSVTKSIVSLGIGALVDGGLVPDIDAPMSTWIPQWADDERQQITLRHVLEHRSGLFQDQDNHSIYRSGDALGHAVDSPLQSTPGQDFRYNNNATNALAAVFAQAAGMRMDDYIDQELFTPLGIEDWWWYRDRGDHPHGMAGLRLRAVDLARLGQLILDRGRVGDREVLSAAWVADSTTASAERPWTAWLWWPVFGEHRYVATPEIVALWVAEGADADSLAGLEDQVFPTAQAFREALHERLGADAVARVGYTLGPHIHPLQRKQQVGAEAQGYLGQYLFVIPGSELVVVRQTRGRKKEDTSFETLRDRVLDLAEALAVEE